MADDAEIANEFIIEIGDIGDDIAALTTISGINSFSGMNGERPVIDTTAMDSAARTHKLGKKDCGSWQIGFNHLTDDAGQVELRAAKEAGTMKLFLITFPEGGTAQFEASVISADIGGALDEKIVSNAVIKISGDYTLT